MRCRRFHSAAGFAMPQGVPCAVKYRASCGAPGSGVRLGIRALSHRTWRMRSRFQTPPGVAVASRFRRNRIW